MTHKGVRSRAAGIFAGAGALSLLLGATALLVAPSANADQPVVANGHKGNPPGNNGTVKIESADSQSLQPDNNPHQACIFSVEFYNFDKGDYNATVTFEDQAPTKDGGLQVVSGNLHPFIGEDAAGGGRDLDARVVYRLKFTGQPHAKQGYHVKLTVNAPGSIGADQKHKVFWVKGCDATPPTSTPPTTTVTPHATKAPLEKLATPPATTPASSDTPDSPSRTPRATRPASPSTSDSPSDTPTANELAPAADVPSDTPTAGVPTEVDAGFGVPAANSVAGSNSPFGLVGGLLLAAGGVMLAGGGIVALRRRGKHSV